MTPQQLKAAVRAELLKKDAFTSNGVNNTAQAIDILIDEFSDGGGAAGYESFAGLITQAGTDDPVITPLTPNLAQGAITWQRDAIGVYLGAIPSGFPVERTAVIPPHIGGFTAGLATGGQIAIGTNGIDGQAADGLLENSFFEVRIYPELT